MNSTRNSTSPAVETAMSRPAALIKWLICVAGLVFAMVVVGGITRLTESGLSITEWKPITGALPPLNEASWLSEFEKYKQIPEYTQINGPAGMTLAEFKFIYLGMDPPPAWPRHWFGLRIAARMVLGKESHPGRI